MHRLTNEFSNHTYDSISFDFTISALEFWIDINFKNSEIISIIPDLCIDLPSDPDDTTYQNSIVCIIPTV